MWSLLLRLNPFTKTQAIAVLFTVNVLAIAWILVSRDAVKKAEAMYEHPAVIQKTEFKRVSGPVRVVEHIVEKPGGERIIERTIDRAPVVITREAASSSTPVAPAGSSVRYLAGASWEASLSHPENVTAWGGYSFGRLDLLGGVGLTQGDHISGHLMVVTRWGK